MLHFAHLLAAAALSAAFQDPAPAAAPPLSEEWMVTLLNGARIGYVHQVTSREPVDDAPGWSTHTEAAFQLGRLGASVEVFVGMTTIENADGQVRRLECETRMSSQPSHITGVVQDGVLQIRSEVMGNTREQEIPWSDDYLSERGLNQRYAAAAHAPAGTISSAQTFDPSTAQVVTYSIETGAPTSIEFRGEQVAVTPIYFETDLLPGMRGTTWIDARGRALRTSQPVLSGMDMVYELSTEEEARAAMHVEEDTVPDVFSELMVRSNVRIPHPRRVDEAVFRVTLKDGVAHMPDFRFDPRQTVEPRGERELLLHVRRHDGAAGQSTLPVSSAPPEVMEALQPSSMVQCDDPAMIAAAREAVGGETDAWLAAQKLERWTYQHIDQKSMGVAFASASEVLQERCGDCSEHAVLLAALCRAVGLPARVCMGWEYAEGIFGGHAWTEAWIGGAWCALDGTNAAGGADATHIALGNSLLADAGSTDLFRNLSVGISAVNVEVVEVSYGGRRVAAADLDAARMLQGDRYVNAQLGLSFTRPAGWQFDEVHPAGFTGTIVELEPEQGDARIEVDARDVPALFSMDELAGMMENWKGPVETSLDGRPAQLYLGAGAERGQRMLFARVDDTLYSFELRAGDDAARAGFQELLASIDFDLR